MKMRTSLHGINKKVSMARALQLAGASFFLELQYCKLFSELQYSNDLAHSFQLAC